LEGGIGPAVEADGLAVRANTFTGERVEPFCACDWQRPQEQRIDQPKRRRAGTDRQRQRQNGRGRGRLRLHQAPPPEDHVGTDGVETRQALDLQTLFAMAKPGAQGAARRHRVAARRDPFLDVRVQLVIDLGYRPIAMQHVG
jgi:hypothetical protein